MKVNYIRKPHNVYRIAVILSALCIVVLLAGCASREPLPEADKMALSVSSPAFQEAESIPDKYTCQGDGVSPPLAWGEPPLGTQSMALIMDDLDAPLGVFTHWVIFNIPPDSRELVEALPTQPQLPDGTLQGKNSFGEIGYGGPCPPGGSSHRYEFTLYALDSPLGLEAGASKKEVIKAMQEHVLAYGRLTGTYQR
jgi:Raf kinase inhibitor-like YbhB/YbcL family protein